MLRDEDIALVRDSVTMKQIAEMYGYRVTRSGFMSCPFHGKDEHPSMKVYDGNKGFHCFVCHKGGDIIDFVRKHDNLDFQPAVRLIANHFGIPIADDGNTLSEADRKRIADRKAQREAAEKEQKANQERLKELGYKIQSMKRMQAEFKPLGSVWCGLQRRIEVHEQEWETLYEKCSK